MAYSGLETLFQNEGPMSGAVTGGQREGLAQIADLQALLKSQLEYQKAQQLAPLEVQQKQNEISRQLPEIELKQLEARKERETLDSSIRSTNAANIGKIEKEKIDDLSNMGILAGRVGAFLSSVPEGIPRQQEALRILQSFNIDPKSTIGQYVLNNPPEKLIDVSEKISKLKDSYIQSLAVENVKGDYDIKKIRAQGEETRKTNRELAEQGRFNRPNKYSLSIEQKIDAENEPAKKMALLLDAAKQAEEAGQSALAESYRARAAQLENLARLRASNANPAAGKVDIGSTAGVPTNPVPPVMPPNTKQQPLSARDQEALNWAKQNPNDPRAKKILQLLGQ